MSKKPPSESKGVYRDGKLLVIREGARFPPRCAICNTEDDVELVEFCFERKDVHGLEARLVQAAATAASDLVTGARYSGAVQADIPLCSWHSKRRMLRAGIAVGMAILAIAFLVIQIALGMTIVPPGELGFLDIAIYNFVAFGMIGVAFYLGCTTLFDSQNLWFRAKKYYHRYAWVTGAGRDFLNALPQYENQHVRSSREGLERQFDRTSDENRDLTAEELIRRANLDDE